MVVVVVVVLAVAVADGRLVVVVEIGRAHV